MSWRFRRGRKAEPAIRDRARLMSREIRSAFLALREAGFTDEQALTILPAWMRTWRPATDEEIRTAAEELGALP